MISLDQTSLLKVCGISRGGNGIRGDILCGSVIRDDRIVSFTELPHNVDRITRRHFVIVGGKCDTTLYEYYRDTGYTGCSNYQRYVIMMLGKYEITKLLSLFTKCTLK